MNPHLAAQETSTPSIYHDKEFRQKHQKINDAIRRNDMVYLRNLVKGKDMGGPVNLSEDSLLNVLIQYGKSNLAIKLLEYIQDVDLKLQNYDGNTALHVATMKGNVQVAKELIKRKNDLIGVRNKQLETPLHKAALYGEGEIFWLLIKEAQKDGEDYAYVRGENGATVLHCAIMGNAPGLALEIATKYPRLMTTRNSRAVTPLQLVVTIPDAFRSKLSLGTLESLIYECIPLEDSVPANKIHEGDIEKQVIPPQGAAADGEGQHLVTRHRSTFPTNYATCFDILSTACVSARRIWFLIFQILKQVFTRVEFLQQQKTNHKHAMEPVECLARDPQYWDFFVKGRTGKMDSTPPPIAMTQASSGDSTAPPITLPPTAMMQASSGDSTAPPITLPPTAMTQAFSGDSTAPPMAPPPTVMTQASSVDTTAPPMTPAQPQNEQEGSKTNESRRRDESLGAKMGLQEFVEQVLKVVTTGAEMGLHEFVEQIHKNLQEASKTNESKRWNESPLTLGAKMGLHEFVEQILNVCPQSAVYLDPEGKNILQVAVQNGQERIVGIVESMATGPNAVLPSWLLSSIDKNTKSTILHFAAEITVKDSAPALQMQTELQWFERVKKLVPEELEYSRNDKEKTAQELFTEKHKEMVKDAKDQLTKMGETYPALVAAVVFASSFSIPGSTDNSGQVIYHQTAFKVFSHAYVVGLSCASTSLVLFLSFLTSPYREQDFRRSLPTKYFFANMSFFIALVALLVAFSCNIYLSIYGGTQRETNGIVALVCELTIFPAVCCFVLLYQGATFGLATFLQHVWR